MQLATATAFATAPAPPTRWLGQETGDGPTSGVCLNIVVVENHEEVLKLTLENLRRQGHRVIGLPCAEAIDDEGAQDPIDLLVVDMSLPGEDGLSLARRIRAAQPQIAILMMAARNSLADRVAAYEHGADMYLAKPAHPAELNAAVLALARRFKAMWQAEGAGSEVSILNTRELSVRGPSGKVAVTGAEAAILSALARAPGRRLENWQIVELLGEDTETYSKASLEVRLTRLRGKLNRADSRLSGIRAIRLRGYQLCMPLLVV